MHVNTCPFTKLLYKDHKNAKCQMAITNSGETLGEGKNVLLIYLPYIIIMIDF